MKNYPFIFGAQYYRAPTPEPACWETDFRRMKALGFNAVKLWVQWRWNHRSKEEFYFDDVDALFDLAHENGLSVTLNTIFDVAPIWLYQEHPEAYQVLNNGQKVLPVSWACRQIGGFSGPCYNHQGAADERTRFLRAVVERYRDHPAMGMWDVWNEPEQSGQYRKPELPTTSCYCPACREKFLLWLKEKYTTLERLNEVWAKCYARWDEVELPRTTAVFADFMDFREFHLDTMTGEAAWRLALVKEMDPAHPAYLHVVPNTLTIFNSVTCVDDFAMAEHCDVFASTNFAGPVWSTQTLSAGAGKVCYNVEAHIANGSIAMHQKNVELPDLLRDFLPQIGMGIRGFMFWQFRREVLGLEAPAWGVVKLNGSDSALTAAVQIFWEKLSPYAQRLMDSAPLTPEIAIWTSRKNELFHFSATGDTAPLAASIQAYTDWLYAHNHNCRYVNSELLAQGLPRSFRLLIMPSCYCLTEAEALGLDAFVRAGGVLLCEAHLGGYNATQGRHSRNMPGCNLHALWGLSEVETTSAWHLPAAATDAMESANFSDDLKKAMDAYGTAGGKYFAVKTPHGVLCGANRFAELAGEDLTIWGTFNGKTCLAMKKVGDGAVVYGGSNFGEGAAAAPSGFDALMARVCDLAQAKPTHPVVGVRVDRLGADMVMVYNHSGAEQEILLNGYPQLTGLYTGEACRGDAPIRLPAGFADFFVSI